MNLKQIFVFLAVHITKSLPYGRLGELANITWRFTEGGLKCFYSRASEEINSSLMNLAGKTPVALLFD